MTRFEDIYRQNVSFVWAAAHRCGVPPEAVDDVVQDVFLTAHRRMDELDWEVSPRGWLYAVTRNLASKHQRSRTRRHLRETVIASRADRSSQPHRRHDAGRTAVALLEQIDVGQREVFVQSELLGMTAPEIAADLGLPLNTVYSRLRLARRRLTALAGDDARLHGAVESLRRTQQPTAAEQRRNQAALMARVGAGWGALSSTALFGLATAGLAGLALVVGLTMRAEAPPADGVTAPEVRARVDGPPPAQPGPQPELPPVAPIRLVEAQAAPAPPATLAKPPTRRVEPPSRGPEDADTLSAEVELLDRARLALRQGRPGSALELLETYDARFPGGQLRAAASSVRARARCAQGPGSEDDCARGVTEPAPRGEP